MSDKNQEYWKELMGEDFKVEPEPGAPNAPEPPAAERGPRVPEGPPEREHVDPGAPEPFIENGKTPVEPGFTIEYIARPDAEKRESGAESDPAAPRQTPHQVRPAEGTARPVQQGQQVQRPAQQGQQAQRPVQQPQRAAQQQPQRQAQQGQQPQQQPSRPGQQAQRAAQQQPQRQAQQGQQPQQQPSRPGQPAQQPQRPVQPAQQAQRQPQGAAGARGRKKGEREFEVEFDFDSEYADVDERAVRRGRTKRTGCLSGILMFLFVVCVSAVLASLGWIWATDVLGLNGEDEAVEVTLPEEYFHTEEREEENDEGEKETVEVTVADMSKVAEVLYQKGLIKYRWLFKLYSNVSGGDEELRPGTYTLNMNYDYRAIVKGMTGRRTSRDTVKILVPEGYTVTQIVDLLVDNGVCERQELLDALKDYDFDYDFLDKDTLGQEKRLEGYLFPDTYEFYVGDDPVNVIRKFLNNFESKWEDDFDALAGELGYSQREILTIASMIEKEAGVDTERDLIASVIYNRLRHPDRQGTNGMLQIDATIYYVTADTGEEFSTELNSPYNTYTNPGLPPGPIANPGIASIRAALSPQETNYYYYALGQNKSHQFFETYNEFTKFVNSEDYGG